MKRFYHKINAKIIITLLILFSITGAAISLLNLYNLRNIYEENFTERVLLTNSVITATVDGDSVEFFAGIMSRQDEGFKARQYQFHLDQEYLLRLQDEGAPEDEKSAVIERLEAFKLYMSSFKQDEYWDVIKKLRQLNEAGDTKRIYVFADTGVTDDSGAALYTCLFDTDDGIGKIYDNTGMGAIIRSVDNTQEVYDTKKQTERVFYSNEGNGEGFYYTFSPIIGSDGNVSALLGTEISVGEMNKEITESILFSSIVFYAFVIFIISTIYIFLVHYVTKPLSELTATAQRLAGGDIYASVPNNALNQSNELGTLAHVIKDMIGVHQKMILNRAMINSNPFTCIIFDQKHNIVDCNLKTLELYRFKSRDELNAGYCKLIASATPEYQPDGRRSPDFEKLLETAFDKGYCEFDITLTLFGKSVPLTTIMKLIEYKNKPAVVAYQFDLTAQKEIQQNLEYRGKLLQAVSDVSDLLLTAGMENSETILYKAFDIMGKAASADRAYIWKNNIGKDGTLYMTQIYEWSPGADPQQGNKYTVNVSYDEAMPSWRDTLFKGECVNNLVKNMEPEAQAQLLPQGIVSILLVPIFIQDKFWGFIGFDDCKKERNFTKTEENILRTCGYMVMSYSEMVQNEVAIALIASREEALSTARTKSNFLANMSHEIRTPMNTIFGMTELILHENASETVLNHAADIKNACRGLLSLINDILDISKIESGKLEIIPTRYYIGSMLMDVISIIKLRADKKGVSFITNIDANLPSRIIGDELRVKQILINLLDNAVKFTHEGYVKLSVKSKSIDDRMFLEFTVSDTGIGIKPEDKKDLFESFQRIDTRRNRNIEGTGLGLSISKQLAEMMEGYITAESEYGFGSSFTVTIPQEVDDAHPIAALKSSKKLSILVYENRNTYLDSIIYVLDNLGCNYQICSNQSDFHNLLNEFNYDFIFASSFFASKTNAFVSKKKLSSVVIAIKDDDNLHSESGILSISMPIHSLQIANILNGEYDGINNRPAGSMDKINMIAPNAKVLVVDDNLVNLKVAVGLLKTYEIHADTASSGARALEIIKESAYDLVLMDHMMPEMDGIDTTAAIRKLGGEYFSALPIIALTANAVSGAREMFKAEGLNDYLAKPIEMPKLNAILKKWIPPEKQCTKTAKSSEKPTVHLELPGLNVQKAIENFAGTLENYMDILSAYALDGDKTLDKITESYDGGDLKMLAIYTHALKSASANIGADELSQISFELELACKNADSVYIDNNINTFIKKLTVMLSNIKRYLKHNEKNPTERKKTADFAALKKGLTDIGAGLENVDIEAIEAALTKLLSYDWDESISSALGKMEDFVTFFDYDGIESILCELERTSNTN